MEKDIKNSRNSEIESSVKIITNSLYNMRKNLDSIKIQRIFSVFRDRIKTRKEKSGEYSDVYDRILKIMDSYENLLNDEGVLNEIIYSNISQKEFLEIHKEQILGDHKRKYDMSGLYNENLISRLNRWSERKKVAFKPNDYGVSYTYQDNTGKTFTITDLGALNYEEWNTVQSSINAYRVECMSGKNKLFEHKVLTQIVIPMMSNEKYKQAVLNELLSENNILLSNCGGYIGEIVEKPKVNFSDMVGTESQDINGYEYRVSDSYILYYDSTVVSASIDFKKREDRVAQDIAKANKINSSDNNSKLIDRSYNDHAGR